jgi:hypothetical protein
MADTSKPEKPLGALIVSQAETVERIREFNERLIASAMAEGGRRLDDYERALTNLVKLTEKACATQLEWLDALAQTHAEFIRDVSKAYTATVRVLLG